MAVYKRGKTYWCEFQIGGERIRKSSGQTSKKKALEFERSLRNEYARQIHLGREVGKTYTYGEGMLRWLESAPKSMLSHARNTLPYLQDVPLMQLPIKCADMRDAMIADGLSPSTINRRLAVAKRILALAYKEWNWIDQPLDRKVSMMSEKGLERDISLTRDEVHALVEAMTSPVAQKVTLIAAFSGLRRGEILSLSEADWAPPMITVRAKNSKSKRQRSVPLIEEMHEHMTVPFQITGWELRKQFEQARDAIERPEIRFHDLRHTFGTWLATSPDIPLTVIRDLLGHSSLAVTSRYANLKGSHVSLVENALSSPHKKPKK